MLDRYFLVDTSYVIYFSSHSAFGHYVKQMGISKSQQNSSFNPTLDEEFNYYFEKIIRNGVLSIAQTTFPLIDRSKFVFCLDCPRKNIWRRDVFPEYKIQRDDGIANSKYNIGECFKYAYNYIIPKLCEEFKCSQIRVGCAEADDVIAVLSEYLTENNKNKCVIISSDRDMVQLYDDNVSIITLDGVVRNPKTDLENLTKVKFKDDITAQEFLLFKILIGDSADNIPNVKAGIGKKKALSYVFNKEKLKQLLIEDKLTLDSFKRNKALISMKDIPIDVKNMIIEEFNDAKTKQQQIDDLF